MRGPSLVLFLFDQEDRAGAEHKERTGDNQHTGLHVRAYIFKEQTSAEGCNDLRNTDGAVKEAEVIAHVTALDSVGNNREGQSQHSCPSSTDEGVAEPEDVLVGNKINRYETYCTNEERDCIGTLVAEPMLQFGRKAAQRSEPTA